MRSVRLGEQLEGRLKEASRLTGLPISQIIREGAEERTAELLGDTADKRLAPFIGKVASGRTTSARNHKAELATILKSKDKHRARKATG